MGRTKEPNIFHVEVALLPASKCGEDSIFSCPQCTTQHTTQAGLNELNNLRLLSMA